MPTPGGDQKPKGLPEARSIGEAKSGRSLSHESPQYLSSQGQRETESHITARIPYSSYAHNSNRGITPVENSPSILHSSFDMHAELSLKLNDKQHSITRNREDLESESLHRALKTSKDISGRYYNSTADLKNDMKSQSFTRNSRSYS